MTPRLVPDETGASAPPIQKPIRLSARGPRTALFVQALVAASPGGFRTAVIAFGRRLLDRRVATCTF